MKRIIILFVVTLSLSKGVVAQNVGIGTNTPTEKLDVNGKLNVQGNIKISGVAGTEGQVLMTNNTGATVWSDLCDFKNIASFTQNGTWVIPAGVTKIIIEAWGGGGGGGASGGGGGGTYIRSTVLGVVPAGSLSIIIGTGGAGSPSEVGFAQNGTSTIVTGTFGTITAYYGNGAANNPGQGTSATLNNSPIIQYPGQSGSATRFNYAQRTASQFVEIRSFGDGGGVAPFYNNGGGGGSFVKDLNTLSYLSTIDPPYTIIHGVGGGGGLTPGGSWGTYGAWGLVIIHY